MKRVLITAMVALVFANTPAMLAQGTDNLHVFGYFQAHFNSSVPKEGKATNTFNLQQLNLFFNKELSSNFNAFVNFELSQSYSSQRSWGYFNLDEAWVKYSPSQALNIQAGMLIPTFNHLNTMKNKTPLLPYVFRPLVYESSISALLDFPAYLPERAFLQVFGTLPVSGASVEYAIHLGNSESSYIAQSVSGIFVPGTDTTTFKEVGGRVGVRWSGVRLGVSATLDRDKQATLMLGNLPRTRVGVDVGLNLGAWALDGEFIHVNDRMNEQQQGTLTAISSFNPLVGTSLEKTFYCANLTYDISDAFYTYGGYSYLDDKSNNLLAKGLSSYTLGGGYRPIETVVVKTQWAYYKLEDNPFFTVEQNSYYVAVSILF